MTRKPTPRTILVSGGNRGIGLEVCRQLADLGHKVILGARDHEAGIHAAHDLARKGLTVQVEPLDVGDETSVQDCAARLHRVGIHVEGLVNNAGIYPEAGLLDLTTPMLEEAMRVNFYGPFWLCCAFVPGMIARGFGRVVNVSSGIGSLNAGLPGTAPYALSKAALNALTVKLAGEVRGQGDLKVNAVCPGWVATRMGGKGAPRSVAQGADTVVWLATLPENGPSGGFFRDRTPIAW
ncbi:MAG: 20-beta-hydroxysteroid dehydrogenase [Alphaproteobacteria bacterium CG_4_10_14_0_2_um_filter_63_37]|nr:MAG: hypothetical protein AUJ55_10250 [Proteobacteria bacterium CG1_02_64_396]PJA25601.1 MAG: 20-beta-hydroxysteroid dehydrogenase [Alphaproteobacteria bacterium CG_4_10_14_0_2_um_filter_63_37]